MSKLIPASKYCVSVFDGTHDTPKPAIYGKPLITSKHISGGTLDTSSAYMISEEDYALIQKRSATSQWDILFSMIGSVGEVYLEKDVDIPYAIKNMGVFSCKDENRAKWLYYYLRSPAAKSHINRYLNGAVQKFLPLGALRDFPVIPFDDEKINLVNVLVALDAKIDCNNRINAELEAMAKTLYDYWFVQFDFPFDFAQGRPDTNGKPYQSSGGKMANNATLKREIPAGWVAVRINELFQNRTDTISSTDVSGDMPYTPIDSLPMKKMSFGIAQSSSEANSSLIQYEGNDILIGAMRVYFHRVCIAPFDGITRTTVIVLRPKKPNHLPYLYQVCNEDRTIEVASKISVGTQQPYVNWEYALENHTIPYPVNDELIQRYSSIMLSVTKDVINRERENAELAKLRDWLLPLLMNGQVTVA